MDTRKILIVNLSKGRIGEDNSRLLGALLITRIQLAAMGRVDIPEEKRNDFHLYVDEFQNFATEAFANILSEARKYRLCLTLGHQYITQMDEKVRDAVFGNIGTLVSFRVGAEDAEYLEKEFIPEFAAADLVNLSKYNIYLKLMIDGIAGRPFSAQTISPLPKPKISYREIITKVSREKYGTPRKVIEDKIAKWTGTLVAPSGPFYRRPKQPKTRREGETIQTISLKEATIKKPIPFSPSKRTNFQKTERKKVDLKELKKVLKQASEPEKSTVPTQPTVPTQENNQKTKKGKLLPGQKIKF